MTRSGAPEPQEYARRLIDSVRSRGMDHDTLAPVASSTRPVHFPLAFSQRAHWNLYQLNTQRAVRQVAAATRLRGPLHIDRLADSIATVIRRHDALRLHLGQDSEGVPCQVLSEEAACRFTIENLTHLTGVGLDEAIADHIRNLILEPVDPTTGPLAAMQLLRLSELDHVLIVALEHMISDEFSLGILLRDLWTTYAVAGGANLPPLPAIPLQFTDYAAAQHRELPQWLRVHETYWNERLRHDRRLRFPPDADAIGRGLPGWTVAPFKIGIDQRRELLEWCRSHRATLVMAVFAAYVALVLRWCDATDGVVLYQANGRDHPYVESTIGYFTSPLYVRTVLARTDTFTDLLRQLAAQYAEAREHADHGFWESQTPRPEFTRNCAFNWVPQIDLYDFSIRGQGKEQLAATPLAFDNPVVDVLERDTEPALLLFDTAAGITGGLYYPRSRFSAAQMETFTNNLTGFLRVLARRPTARIMDIPLLR